MIRIVAVGMIVLGILIAGVVIGTTIRDVVRIWQG